LERLGKLLDASWRINSVLIGYPLFLK